MTTNGRSKLNVVFDAHHFTLRQSEMDKLYTDLNSLSRQVAHFPVADLRVLIEYNPRNNDYSVKLSLILPGATLVTNDHDTQVHPAFERALSALEANVQAYKDKLGQVPERQREEKHTVQHVEPTPDPDPRAIDDAVRNQDYPAFRTATLAYEEALRKRIGRWVERYPDVQARIDRGLKIADIVEDVFLTAFEECDRRPPDIRFGDWLAALIDPAVKALQHRGDEELENVRLAQSALRGEGGPGRV
jgi:ribosome-associated translation inhibitor RaiA